MQKSPKDPLEKGLGYRPVWELCSLDLGKFCLIQKYRVSGFSHLTLGAGITGYFSRIILFFRGGRFDVLRKLYSDQATYDLHSGTPWEVLAKTG